MYHTVSIVVRTADIGEVETSSRRSSCKLPVEDRYWWRKGVASSGSMEMTGGPRSRGEVLPVAAVLGPIN